MGDMQKELLRLIWEASKKIVLKKDTDGVNFDSDKKVKIPKGEYSVVEADDRKKYKDYTVITNEDGDLFSINNKEI